MLLPIKVSPMVKEEQVRLLYTQGTTVIILGILTAFISVAMLWDVADHRFLTSWLMILLTISSVRLIINIHFLYWPVKYFSMQNCGRIFILGTMASGIIWGYLAFIFDPAWPVTHQLILFVIYSGLTAGALNSNASVFPAFLAFYLPMFFLFIVALLLNANESYHTLYPLFLIYIILMYSSSLRYHNHLANNLEVLFENERLSQKLAESNEQLSVLAQMDELTQIANRRSMNSYLKVEWNRHLRSKKALSLLFIDLDYFKQFNDTYGHHEGDQCLIQLAQLLKNSVKRSDDMVARFGGEEFAVILPETEREAAYKIAEKLRLELEALDIEHATSKISDHVTMSVGIATIIPQQAESEALLLAVADKALYKAKEMGRNRVVQAH